MHVMQVFYLSLNLLIVEQVEDSSAAYDLIKNGLLNFIKIHQVFNVALIIVEIYNKS